MAEKLNLNNYKASGVYTVEIDESTNLSLPLSTGRLVIGSSKKGPINSVVLVNDSRTLSAVYGDTDPKMEKNGSYFHRTIEVALRQGPVYALNVLPVSDTDIAYFATFNTESASANATWTPSAYQDSISHFYNTQKLWYADGDQVSKYKNIKLGDPYPATGSSAKAANKILTVVNLSKKPITAWVKVADTNGYNITVKDYYALLGNKVEVPAFLHPDDLIADYFVEIIAIEGDWSDSLRLSNDPVYGQYFNETGLMVSKMDSFFSLREITVAARQIGCIIPEFSDLAGSIASIDTLFNRRFAQSGIFCALDHAKVDMMDLTNATFSSGSSTEPIAQQRIDLVGYGFDEMSASSYGVDDGIPYLGIDKVKIIDVMSYLKAADHEFNFKLTSTSYTTTYATGETYIVSPVTGSKYIVAAYGSKLYSAWANGFVKTGDSINYKIGLTSYTQYLSTDGVVKTQALGQIKYIIFTTYSDITLTTQVDSKYISDGNSTPSYFLNIIGAVDEHFKHSFDLTDSSTFITSGAYAYSYTSPNQLVFTLSPYLYGNSAKRETANSGFTYNADLREDIDGFFVPGQYVKASQVTDSNGNALERNRLLRIKSVYAKPVNVTVTAPSSGTSGTAGTSGASTVTVKTLQYTVTVENSADTNITGIDLTNSIVKAYIGIKNYVTSLNGSLLPSMVINEGSLYPNGTAARQDVIMDYLFNSTNLASTLADRETLNFRYIIDSFEGQISTSSKHQLAQLAANHGQALAILNAPSFAQYEKSVDPSFIDYTNNLVSTEYISTGGNMSSNPSFLFGFASGDRSGIPISSYTAYFMPNVLIFEGGKNKSVPPAAYVGNAYMKKYSSGNTFSIVGGKRGILNDAEITGVEYDLTDDDRAFLEPAGFNLIVRRRGFGVMILSNNTGYQRVQSALNNIHVREALITIERDVNRILFNFLFDFNDPTTRLRVKTLVKNYLSAVQDANGISTWDLVFDDSNNISDVITNNAGIIDIIVDFPRGIQKFINRITITRTGGQLASQSTGFTPSF